MNNILSIETATSSCSVALRIEGEIVVRSEVGSNIHSKVVLDMIDDLLSSANIGAQDLDAVAVGQGPGSFTGLRIGVGVGQGLAFGASCPMIGVSSLDALAMQTTNDGAIVVGIDARMGEIYWCEYIKQDEHIDSISDICVTAPESVQLGSDSCGLTLVGNAWAEYRGQFTVDIEPHIEVAVQAGINYPCAGALLRLAELKYLKGIWFSAADFAPIYVRDDVAKKSTKPLPGLRP